MMKQEKECLKCGNYFETWENQEMCNECEEFEKNNNKLNHMGGYKKHKN